MMARVAIRRYPLTETKIPDQCMGTKICALASGDHDMELKADTGFQVVDKRRSQNAEGAAARRPTSPDQRAHSVLLGYYNEDQARRYLDAKGVPPDLLDELLREHGRAQARIQTLTPLGDGLAMTPLEDVEALKEVYRVMARPECKGAYPQGSWTAELVEISKIIPLQPDLDIDYSESLGSPSLDAKNLMAAVKFCFAEKHSTDFHAVVDESQKAVTINGINPSLEVVGLRYHQVEDHGPLIVSFMVSPAPNIVCVSLFEGRHFLSSGYHRVYRLMKAGLSHVPCALREVGALEHTGANRLGLFPQEVLMAPRPPLFPDFADPVLGVIVPFRAVEKVIRIRPDEYFV
jgi:hypothetical protein